ncbi:redoxin domain-containing protein [Paenibacillus yanchengensis]|uniref:Redoxin domain-containing protein n=1 Tax=Paenibacillus yanchengensis TaxID=2035833 RepID=A0ABW4YJS2_9BACL
MKKNRKLIQVVILVAALLIGGISIGATLADGKKVRVKEGGPPPDFNLSQLEGGSKQLADYKGKPLIINFWGTFCEPCVTEMPEFERQYQKWKDQGLEIAAINLRGENTLTITKFVESLDLSYNILRDVDSKTEKMYGVRQYPTTYFVKPDGNVMEIVSGPMTEKDIEERVVRLLQQ